MTSLKSWGILMSKWTTTKISKLAKGYRGVSYKPHDLKLFPEDNDVVLLRSNNIADGKVNFDKIQIVPKRLAAPEQILQTHDVAICMANGSRLLVGKTAQFVGYEHSCVVGSFCSLYRSTNISEQLLKYIFQSAAYKKAIDILLSGSAINNLNNNEINKILIYHANCTREQRKIAEVLSTVDEAIDKTYEILDKHTKIKRGLMQDLLSQGVETKLNQCLKVRHGKSQKKVEAVDGQYPILGTGGLMGMAKVFIYNKPSVLIGRKGTIDSPEYMETPFWTIDTLYYTEMLNGNCAKYFYYIFQTIDWYKYNEATGVPSLSCKGIGNITVKFIKDVAKQKEIVEKLTVADEHIQAERNYLAKLQAIKTGLMQDLLTNKVSVKALLKEGVV